VKAAFSEDNQDAGVVAEALRPALDDLAQFVGVGEWIVDGKLGDVTPLLR
jgi:hypothetical protein